MIYLSTLDIPSTHIWDGNISSIGTADTYMGWRRIGHPGDKSVRHETGLKSIPRPNLGQPNPSNSMHPCCSQCTPHECTLVTASFCSPCPMWDSLTQRLEKL